jgi:hypothetical protein
MLFSLSCTFSHLYFSIRVVFFVLIVYSSSLPRVRLSCISQSLCTVHKPTPTRETTKSTRRNNKINAPPKHNQWPKIATVTDNHNHHHDSTSSDIIIAVQHHNLTGNHHHHQSTFPQISLSQTKKAQKQQWTIDMILSSPCSLKPKPS